MNVFILNETSSTNIYLLSLKMDDDTQALLKVFRKKAMKYENKGYVCFVIIIIFLFVNYISYLNRF